MSHDRNCLAYLELACVSQRKRQRPGRDKFLLLAGNEACQAGLLDAADRCRRLVIEQSPNHLLSRFDSFAEALRSPAFVTLLTRIKRFCTQEMSEHLLNELQIPLPETDSPMVHSERIADLLEMLEG